MAGECVLSQSVAASTEAWGRGIERIVEACKGAGTPEPQFKYDGGGLWTTFFFSKEYQDSLGTTESRPKTTQETTQESLLRRTELQSKILNYLKDNPSATRGELVQAIPNSTINGIKYNLSKLQKVGLLKRIGSTKSGHWEVIKSLNSPD